MGRITCSPSLSLPSNEQGWGDWIKGQIWGKNWAEGKEKNGEGMKVCTGRVDGTGPHAV